MERRHRNSPFAHCAEVGTAVDRVIAGEIADPEIFAAHGVGHGRDLDIGGPTALAYDLHPRNIAFGDIGKIDVHQHAVGPGNPDEATDHIGAVLHGAMPSDGLAFAHR